MVTDTLDSMEYKNIIRLGNILSLCSQKAITINERNEALVEIMKSHREGMEKEVIS